MKLIVRCLPVLALVLSLAACQKPAASTEAAAAPGGAPAATSTTPAATGAEPAAEAATPATPADAGFDIESVPVSNAALGEFPYFALPDGYQAMNKPVDMDYARFPFWTGRGFEWVEGRSHESSIEAADGKTWSEFELRKNLETLLASVGAVKVASSRIPREWSDKLEDDTKQGHIEGLGDIYNEAATVYVIRRADRNIWIHFVTTSAMGNWLVMETKPFVASAKLIDASAMKKSLDDTGKVALHVNFGTDSTVIEPASKPQVEQVVQLLEDDGALRLSVDGHTDNTGDPAHNKALSEGRARSVVAALVTRGIDDARLQAHGYGDSRPVADNGTEAGRAQNRRVELVKR